MLEKPSTWIKKKKPVLKKDHAKDLKHMKYFTEEMDFHIVQSKTHLNFLIEHSFRGDKRAVMQHAKIIHSYLDNLRFKQELMLAFYDFRLGEEISFVKSERVEAQENGKNGKKNSEN